MSDLNFILDFQQNKNYPYMEEINEGILKHIPPGGSGKTILDVGAGRGVLGAAMSELGYVVYALEVNNSIAEEARSRVYQVICADLQDLALLRNVLNGKKFNYIVFSDILEHLFDPLQFLRAYQEFLQPDGKILISVPNAVNWLNRLRFVFGGFNYEMTGVMDRTHIRFFTVRSAKKMVKASGCKLVIVDYTPFLVRAFLPIIQCLSRKRGENNKLMGSSYYKFYRKFIYPVEYGLSRLLPTLFAFRIIIIASKIDGEKNQ